MRGHLLNTVKDKNFQIALIEEAVGGNFFRYFFQMPTLARFELETHQRAERDEPLTANSMIALMADLFAGFGPGFDMDRERVGVRRGLPSGISSQIIMCTPMPQVSPARMPWRDASCVANRTQPKIISASSNPAHQIIH